jgi:DNA-binding NarL/FixJ family response regulator
VIFVLTTSSTDRDIEQAYAQNVAGYIVKSRAGEDFSHLVGLVDHCWRYVELPRVE